MHLVRLIAIRSQLYSGLVLHPGGDLRRSRHQHRKLPFARFDLIVGFGNTYPKSGDEQYSSNCLVSDRVLVVVLREPANGERRDVT